MKWIKKGLIIKPAGLDWMVTHAQNPFPEHIGMDFYKIHFAGRDRLNRAQGGYVVININEPDKILDISREPTLGLGELGCFDDSGAMPSCIINYNDKQYMYYTGWTQGVSVPYYFYIGLAVSDDRGVTFKRISKAPVLGRGVHDPYLTCSPFILVEHGIWRMWYVSSIKRTIEDGKPKPYYHIKYAESLDGVEWIRRGIVCIDFKDDKEYAISRNCVIKEDRIYKMWYSCCADKGYWIGYAESGDGIKWQRKDDEVGIDVSEEGWDSEMIAYPWVFDHGGERYMLYNGNGFGRDGAGLAVLDYKEN